MDELLGRVADRFEDQLAPLADRIVARMRAEIRDYRSVDTPQLWDIARRVTIQSRAAQARHLRNGRAEPKAISDADAEAVHISVHTGFSVAPVLHAFRIGHDVSLEQWLNAAEQADLSEEQRSTCIRAIVRFAIDYDDRLARLVEAEFEDERNRVLGKSDQARLRAMRDVVEGVSDSAPLLDYDLTLEHIGLIAWGAYPDSSLQALAHALDARLISAPTPSGFRWAWLGSRSFETNWTETLRRLTPRNSVRLAAGQPGTGVEGFRRTHRQAGAAHVVATRRPQPVTLHEDVALEALALRDETEVAEFVTDTLRGINEDDPASIRLRETLFAYFASEQNASSTAAALRVHEATISRRMAEIERRMGRRVNQRRAEIETALRLRELIRIDRS